jgi:hypothetical protein
MADLVDRQRFRLAQHTPGVEGLFLEEAVHAFNRHLLPWPPWPRSCWPPLAASAQQSLPEITVTAERRTENIVPSTFRGGDFRLNASQPVSLVYDDVVHENPILKGFPASSSVSRCCAARRARSAATRRSGQARQG